MFPKVLVLLAAYNGEAWIDAQIQSILLQERVDVTLLIGDDCSSDSTQDICLKYSSRDSRVLYKRNEKNLGVTKNFYSLLDDPLTLHYEYIAFSDQDDIWRKEKLYKAIEKLKDVDKPALYYSNVYNVDADLKNGYYAGDRFYKKYLDKGLALIASAPSGCTEVFNSDLLRLMQHKFPEKPIGYHDTWVHFVALFFGTVIPDMGHSYILRRISGNNLAGVNKKNIMRYFFSRLGRDKGIISKRARQFLNIYSSFFTSSDYKLVSLLADSETSFISRIRIFFDKRYHSYTLKGTMLIKIKILFGL